MLCAKQIRSLLRTLRLCIGRIFSLLTLICVLLVECSSEVDYFDFIVLKFKLLTNFFVWAQDQTRQV